MKAFECKMCGTCCYGKGGIFVERDEIERIADFMGITAESCVSAYCEEVRGRLSIKTGPDRFCIFYSKEKKCLIHPVKPHPCSLWPFYPAILRDPDDLEMVKGACPGIHPECSFDEFVRQSPSPLPRIGRRAR